MSFGLWKNVAFFFVDVTLDEISKDVKPGVKCRRPRPRPEPIQFLQQHLHEVMFLDRLIHHLRILEDRAKGRINNPLFHGRVDGEFADDPMCDLRFLPIAGLSV